MFSDIRQGWAILMAMLILFIPLLILCLWCRTPEHLGKKIEAFEMKMASLVILIPTATVLIGTAIRLRITFSFEIFIQKV